MKVDIAVTGIILKDNKALLTKRSLGKKKWPGKWTVPGGNLEESDYLGTPTKINNQWYGTLENCLRREIWEETNLDIENIRYLCNIAVPECVIVSFVADWKSGEVKLQETECSDYYWVSRSDLENFDLIDGIREEIELALVDSPVIGHK